MSTKVFHRPPAIDGLDFDAFAQRPAQHVVDAADQAAEVDDLRRKRLSSSERQQLRGELRSARDGGDRGLQPLLGARIAGDVATEQLQVAADDLQDVVEVVRHAAGELADGLHLLRLAQLRLGLRAFGDGCGDALLERLVGLPQDLLGLLAVGDVDDRADIAEKPSVVAEAGRRRRSAPSDTRRRRGATGTRSGTARGPRWPRERRGATAARSSGCNGLPCAEAERASSARPVNSDHWRLR